ncbi:hypothetical protein PR048_026849 [Dryococelus australis]|uniref:Uncharacterized protein n=1 Tax=Dryococelus australis TaxID=614101 RepID=A0ABQ9GMG2_9NEOP|nr:hypothetical protein PR048_026849 [Dryococelus australis]
MKEYKDVSDDHEFDEDDIDRYSDFVPDNMSPSDLEPSVVEKFHKPNRKRIIDEYLDEGSVKNREAGYSKTNEMKSPCKRCRMICTENISEEDHFRIFNNYWSEERSWDIGIQTPPNKLKVIVRKGITDYLAISQLISVITHMNVHSANIWEAIYLLKECIACNRDENNPENNKCKRCLYRDILNTEFNLAFHQPNDTCNDCDRYYLLIKEATSQEDIAKVKERQECNLTEASFRYDIKKTDKEIAMND